MKRIYVFLLISFLLIPIKISASCTTSTCVASSWGDNGIDKIVQRLDKSDNNIYGSYHGQNIFLMARQLSGTNVYCIKDGETLPAKDPTKACNTKTTINSNSVTNEKLRAAIGYILNYSESYKNAIFDKDDNPVEIKNSYMQTQYLIHQVLAAKNGDRNLYTGAMTATEQNIYNGAIREFNNYKSQSVDIGNIKTNLNGNNYEIIAAITTQKLTTNGTYTVKAGSTVLASGAIAPNATQLKISIDKSKLSSLKQLELSVLYDKEGFYLASFKSCGNGYQPITESNIERIDYPKISDSATINVNLTYTINIVHWKYVGPGNGNNGGINDCLSQSTEKLGDYTVGSTVSVPYGRAKSYDGYSLSYIGTHLGGTISYQAVSEGFKFTMPAASFQLDYVYYPNKVYITYNVNGGTLSSNRYSTNNYSHIRDKNSNTEGGLYFHQLSYGESDDPYDAATFGLTRPGYTFAGWKVRSTGQILDQSTVYNSTVYAYYNDKNKTTANTAEVWCYLDAQWIPNKVYITYNVNGGTLSSNRYSTNNYSHIKDSKSNSEGGLYFHQLSYGESDDPYDAATFGLTRPGYTFAGWKVRSTGQILDQSTVYDSTVYAYYNDKNKTTANTAEVWCYLDAQWQKNQYTINIVHWKYVGDGNGNNGGVNNYLRQYTETLGNYTVGSHVTVPSGRETNFDNHYFRYIGTHIGGTIPYQTVEAGYAFTMPAANFQLDYVYYPEFDIIYHGNGGVDRAGHNKISDIAQYGPYYTIKGGNIFNKRDYVFDGWTTNSDGIDDGYGWTGWNNYWYFMNNQRGIEDYTLNLYARWKDACIANFKNNKKDRIELYNSLETKRKNLLNFELDTAEEACEYYESNYNPNTSCLKTNQINDSIENDFDSENLSDFNDTIVNNNKISYCLTDFELELDSGIDFNNPVKAGRLVLESDKDEDAIIGTLTKTCYIHQDDIDDYKSYGEINESLFDDLYSDNIEDVYLDGKTLDANISDPDITSYSEGEFYKVTATIMAKYKFNEVSAFKLSGKECVSPNNECSVIGYGVLSKFVDAKDSNQGSFGFQIKKGPNSVFNFKNEIDCTYTVEPEIIKYNDDNGKLDLEFRTIDTREPFNRTPKSNWNDGSNKKDSNNSIINDHILNAPNSYGLQNGEKQTPKYKITLTPNTIKEIRNNNKSTPYDVYYESCDAGDSCMSKSKFIHDLYERGVIE